jgi:2'-5' RNA ligase
MTEEKLSLYMWAVAPPPDIAWEIDAIRKEFSVTFQCYKALRPPVHLTLYQPFRAPDAMVGRHISALGAWIGAQPAFALVLRDFGFFERLRSPVVFIDVLPSGALQALNSGLSRRTASTFGLEPGRSAFHPHFTIGYRDISPLVFPEVKKAYSKRPFSAAFDVSYICLFRHSGLKWELLHFFDLGPAIPEPGALF